MLNKLYGSPTSSFKTVVAPSIIPYGTFDMNILYEGVNKTAKNISIYSSGS